MSKHVERDIVKAVLKCLNEHGKAIKIHGNEYVETGTPDILGCIGGKMVAVEVKQPGKKPTKIQEHRLKQWREAGALTCWVSSEKEFREWLTTNIK